VLVEDAREICAALHRSSSPFAYERKYLRR
jgi:hypothetical protein